LIRVQIFKTLKDDKQHKPVVKDMKRDAHWNMVQIRTALGRGASQRLRQPPEFCEHSALANSQTAKGGKVSKTEGYRATAWPV
jgi:hypothetical protein